MEFKKIQDNKRLLIFATRNAASAEYGIQRYVLAWQLKFLM